MALTCPCYNGRVYYVSKLLGWKVIAITGEVEKSFVCQQVFWGWQVIYTNWKGEIYFHYHNIL